MRIRLATEHDLPAVGEITVAAYAEFMVGAEHDDYRTRLADAGPRSREAELWVADDDDQLLGSVVGCPVGSPWREIGRDDEGEFRMLAVAPQARGRGVGEALVRHVEERFAAAGIDTMVLSTLPRMSAAHRLYMRLGYRRDAERDWSPVTGVELWAFSRAGSGTARRRPPPG